MLFFGTISRYKGLEILIKSLKMLLKNDKEFFLLIGGPVYKSLKYSKEINNLIESLNLENQIIKNFEFIQDDKIERYFKAADCIILPYHKIYQSGVLFLAYNFGLPVVATNVGSFKEYIHDDFNGFLCKVNDSVDLNNKITKYFESNMYKNLKNTREKIKNFAMKEYSWASISHKTIEVYKKALG